MKRDNITGYSPNHDRIVNDTNNNTFIGSSGPIDAEIVA